jgi:pyruvate dehydrogenase kinase 2/3/4
MRDAWGAASEPLLSQGLTRSSSNNTRSTNLLASKAMRLKLSGKLSREVSERRQVGDAEEMFNKEGQPWWRNVGMEEGF